MESQMDSPRKACGFPQRTDLRPALRVHSLPTPGAYGWKPLRAFHTAPCRVASAARFIAKIFPTLRNRPRRNSYTTRWDAGDPGMARVPDGEGSDLNVDLLNLLMAGWAEIAKAGELLTCQQVMSKTQAGKSGQGILDAIEMAFPGKHPSPVELGSLLRRFRNRIHQGAFFDHDPIKSAAGRRWHMLSV